MAAAFRFLGACCLLTIFANHSIAFAPAGKETQKALEAIALAHILEIEPRFKLANNDRHSPQNLEQFARLLKSKSSKHGMFVSIFDRRSKALLGCMGSLYPTRATLLAEIRHWSTVAATMDPRFAGKRRRTRDIAIIVSLTGEVKPVASHLQVNVVKYGIKAEFAGAEALLLPGEAWTSQYALKLLRRKMPHGRLPVADTQFSRIAAQRFGTAKELFYVGSKRDRRRKGFGG